MISIGGSSKIRRNFFQRLCSNAVHETQQCRSTIFAYQSTIFFSIIHRTYILSLLVSFVEPKAADMAAVLNYLSVSSVRNKRNLQFLIGTTSSLFGGNKKIIRERTDRFIIKLQLHLHSSFCNKVCPS